MNVLAIDTSSQVLSVAILKDEQLYGQFTIHAKRNHSTKLMPAIESLMNELNITPNDLDEIVVAKGPGSYTGIRIGITTAKTMSWALNIPLYVVSSLEVLSYRAFLIGGYVCPIFDARRGLVFTGLYQRDNESMIEVKSDCNILFSDWLQEINEFIGSTETITFLSPELGAFKKEIIDIIGKRANFLPDIYNHSEASYLYQAKASKHLAETHTVTPNYLRLSEAEANWIRQQKR